MKLLCCGDLHLTDNRPVNRTDNYWETCKRKLNFIFDTAEKEQADAILSPGDMTDTPVLSNIELRELIELFQKRLTVDWFCCFGQHDLRFRTKQNSALKVLEQSIENLCILENWKWQDFTKERISVLGSGYGEEIPDPIEGHFNILLVHRMIIEEKLWSAQELYEPSNIFLRQHPFDLIVSGDNHQPFIAKAAGSKHLLINCGATMRNSIALVNHKPFVVLFDTETKAYKQIFIPIEPEDKVFRMEKVIVEKERNENLESFVTGLSQQKEVGFLFEDNLKAYAKENNIEDEVIAEIYESFEKKKG